MTVGVDLGMLTVTVAAGDGVTDITAPAGGPRAGIRAALAAARPRGGLCLAVPEMWLSGEVAAASQMEDVRYECEDVARAAGHLDRAARRRGRADREATGLRPLPRL